jgi:hypothetical protein
MKELARAVFEEAKDIAHDLVSAPLKTQGGRVFLVALALTGAVLAARWHYIEEGRLHQQVYCYSGGK